MQKNADDYTEDDLMAIDEYEKASAALNDERMEYKNMLENEKTEIQMKEKNDVDKLDYSIFELFRTKMKYDSAILQENLKIKRLSKLLSDNDKWKQQIKLYKY